MTFITNSHSMLISVDINGTKGPNKMGRDGFVFVMSTPKNRLILLGEGLSREKLTGSIKNYSFSSCTNKPLVNIRYAGSYCGALIMFDGWQIAPDYPW